MRFEGERDRIKAKEGDCMRKQTPELLIGETREAFLRRLIAETGMTIKDFAKKAGIPVTSMGTILKRGVGTTSFDTAYKISQALEIDLDALTCSECFSGTTDTDISIIDVSQKLQNARYALRYRAAMMAEMLGISLAHYLRFESAHYVVPAKYLRAIAKIMGVSYEYLSGKTETDPAIEGLMHVESPEDFEAYDFGRAIMSFRKERGLTQGFLAERMGIAETVIQQWELRIRVPTDYDLIRLCEVFSAEGKAVELADFYKFNAQQESIVLSKKEKDLVISYRSAEEKLRQIVDTTLDLE